MIELKGKGCTVKVIADSISPAGARLTTLQLRYWRAIHAEFMTHRVFSRNASSSRAIPVARMIDQVRNDPAGPVYWGSNKAGMQAGAEVPGVSNARMRWRDAALDAALHAELLAAEGLHKQIVNRILEPFQYIEVVATATDWENFYGLRCHPDAQPEMQDLACTMRDAMMYSNPEETTWHLPYITEADYLDCDDLLTMAKRSAARCARVSYLKHDGDKPTEAEDLALFERLVGSAPIHASPTEHQAIALSDARERCRNFAGWQQFRVYVEGEVQHGCV